MSPKKRQTKKNSPVKNRSKKKTSAAPMPSLMFNDTFSESTPRSPLSLPSSSDFLFESDRTSPRQPRYSNYSSEAKRYLYAGVILISAIIFVLWGWSLKKQIGSINWADLPEKKMLAARPTDWDSMFAEREANRSAQIAKNQLKELVNALSTATSTSSTPATTSSTVPVSSTPKTLPSSQKISQ